MFKKLNPDLMLVIVAIIWGTGFIATEYAFDAGMTPAMILVIRFGFAALLLGIILWKKLPKISRREWIQGGVAGVLLFLGFFFQTLGQSMTTVSNSAFLTAVYVVLVPFIVWILTKDKPKTKIFFTAALTFVGIVILTVNLKGSVGFNIGDIYILICAVMFASHLAYTGIAVKHADPIRITFIQMVTATVLSVLNISIFGAGDVAGMNLIAGLPAVIYLGIFSTCICFFLQTSAQKRTPAGKAGIIMSTESFFGSLFSVMLGMEPLTTKILLGGVIILTAVILTEVDLNFARFRKSRENV
jgi:drug/metabolite transporter (DMT)-like permease